jgi:hypothetical protein
MRQLRSLITSRAAAFIGGLKSRAPFRGGVIDRPRQLPSPLSGKRLQKKADTIFILVYADAR